MNKENIDLVKAVGSNLSRVIAAGTVSGPLTGLIRAAKSPARLQSLLQTMSTKWLLAPPAGVTSPLLTTRQFEILFDPDGQSWLYRQLLVIAVLEELSTTGWRPTDARAASDDLDEESADTAASDDLFMEEAGVEA